MSKQGMASGVLLLGKIQRPRKQDRLRVERNVIYTPDSKKKKVSGEIRITRKGELGAKSEDTGG